MATWATFLYIGFRARRWRWIACSAGYLVGFLAVLLLTDGADPDSTLALAATGLSLVIWVGGIAHAYLIRHEVAAMLTSKRPQKVSDLS
jgi:hypothetical protein